MRGATECAKRLKLLFSSLRSKLGKVGHPSVGDPITQLILGVLSRNTPEAKASEELDRLRGVVVDFNELRVIPPIELAETLGDFPEARLKCEDISRSLNNIFAIEHIVSLDRLADLSRKDTQTYLERIDGLEPYTIARIRLLGLRQHAVPLDEAMWAMARQEQFVGPRCSLLEAQQCLERQVAEEDALEFFTLLKKHSWNELATAVRKGETERIISVPPDRSARNMLQTMSFDLALDGDEEEPPPEFTEAQIASAAAAAKAMESGSAKPPRHPGTHAKRGGKQTAARPPAKHGSTAASGTGARVKSKRRERPQPKPKVKARAKTATKPKTGKHPSKAKSA